MTGWEFALRRFSSTTRSGGRAAVDVTDIRNRRALARATRSEKWVDF